MMTMERSDSRTDEARGSSKTDAKTGSDRDTGTPATPDRTTDRDRVTAPTSDPAVTPDSRNVFPDPAASSENKAGAVGSASTGTDRTAARPAAGASAVTSESDREARKDHSDRTDRSVTTPDRSAPGRPDRTAREGDRTDRSVTTPDRSAPGPDGSDRTDRPTREGDRSDPTTTLADQPASSGGASPFATRPAGSTSASTPAADKTGGLGAGDSREVDRLTRRMDTAVGGFVDDPRRAVREADAVLEETATRLTRLLEERRSALRKSWHGDSTADNSTGDTEELRVALTHYRDMTRQLLNI
jgi:hypothetical protein